jgi:hypothetical protein
MIRGTGINLDKIKKLVGHIDGYNNDRYRGCVKGGNVYMSKSKRKISGGMSFISPDTEKLSHEEYEKYDVDNMSDYIRKMIKDGNIAPDEKYNRLLKEFNDLIENEEVLNLFGKTIYEGDNKNTMKYILKGIEKMEEKYTPTEEQKKIKDELSEKEILKNNPHFDDVYKRSKELILNDEIEIPNNMSKDTFIPIQRGNISEDDYTKNPFIFQAVDNDESETKNTKDYSAYNPEFIDTLVNNITSGKIKSLNNLSSKGEILKGEILKDIEETYLKYVPIDIIKGNTLWELKSYGENIIPSVIENKGKKIINNGQQHMEKSKLIGYKDYKGNQLYSFDIDEGEEKVKNIYFHNDGKKIPILKNNHNGYKYYWLYDNKDISGTINPLKKENYKKFMNDIEDEDGLGKYIYIDNKLLNPIPNSYLNVFTIGKKNNRPLKSTDDYNKTFIKPFRKPFKK